MNYQSNEEAMQVTQTAMLEAGVNPEESQETDYFGFSSNHEFIMPNGRQKIFFSAMNEGAKSKFQKVTSRDLRVNRQSGDAHVKMDPAAERHALIEESVTGWTLRRKNPQKGHWEDAPFNQPTLRRFLEVSDPAIIEDLEKEIRKANPWMMDELTVEEIDREVENLQELRVEAVKREEGKEASAS